MKFVNTLRNLLASTKPNGQAFTARSARPSSQDKIRENDTVASSRLPNPTPIPPVKSPFA